MSADPRPPNLRLVPPPWLDDEPPPRPPPARPDLIIGPTVHENVDRLDEAMQGVLFQQCRSLVRVLPALDVPGVADETPILKQLSPGAALDLISRTVRCIRWVPPSPKAIKLAKKMGDEAPEPELKEIVPSHRTAIEPFLSRGHWTHTRPIRAVTEAPILRPDGSVLQIPGYDMPSGYLYSPRVEFPVIPSEPTQADARAALAELERIFVDFPHVSRAHRMVPLAALLTILARPAIDGPTPAFIFDATVRGSGKTLQGDVVHVIAEGRRSPHGTLRVQEEEREKTLGGYAIRGARVVFIDNVKGLLGGPAIEATLTSTMVSFRMLGRMEIMELPWLSILLVSGNNLQLTDDMVRRCLVSRLESQLDDPTTRTEFTHPELVAWAMKERPHLLSLGLIVLRAFIAHGSPDAGAGSLGEPYGPWSRLIPQAIVFAGGANPLDCRPPRESVGLDELGALRQILHGWERIDPTFAGMTVQGIIRTLAPRSGFDGPDALDDLREAMDSFSPPKGGRVDARSFSHALRRHRGRWVDGRRIDHAAGAKAHGGSDRWVVQKR